MRFAVGDEAPDFTLADQHGQDVRLSAYRGRAGVLLLFYPYAFSPVCSQEMAEVRDHPPGEGVEVLGISVDSMFVLRHFGEHLGLGHRLLSDFWPHGEVARTYGVLDEELGCARRASVAIDVGGVVRWTVENRLPDPRDAEEQRRVLDLVRA